LRVSTEKILTSVGMTKDDYFNYDKDGVDMRPGNHQIDWSDVPFPVYSLHQFQSKAAHIEELRHYIEILWKERWNTWEGVPYTVVNNTWFKGDLGSVAWLAPIYSSITNLESLSGSSIAGNYSMAKTAAISSDTLLINFVNSTAITQIAPTDIAYVLPGTGYPFYTYSLYASHKLKIASNLPSTLTIRPSHTKFTFDLVGLSWTSNHIKITEADSSIRVDDYDYPEFQVYIVFQGVYTKYYIIYRYGATPSITTIGDTTTEIRNLTSLTASNNILNLIAGWTGISYIEFSFFFMGLAGEVTGAFLFPLSIDASSSGSFSGGLDNIGLA
jgi:hypothetical protein